MIGGLNKLLFLTTIFVALVDVFLYSQLKFKSKIDRPVVINKHPIKSETIKEESVEEEVITFMAAGDVMLGRSVNTTVQELDDYSYPFRNVSDLLTGADITLVNLENPLVDPCPLTETGMIFCAPTSSVNILAFAGIDVVNLANNHSLNYGKVGYTSTIKTLENEAVKYSDAESVATVVVDDVVFGFIGFDLVFKKTPNDISKRILQAKENVDVLVVSFHWGNEYEFAASERQQSVGKLAVDSGADLVIGHHPHVVQPIEEYKGKLIVYSLGNFVFDQMWSEETKEGVVGKFYFRGEKLDSYEFIPIYIGKVGQPDVVEDKTKKDKILSRLRGGT